LTELYPKARYQQTGIYQMKLGFLHIGIIDVIDIALVAFLLYQIYQLIKGSIAGKVFLGYLFIYIAYLIARALGMELTSRIFNEFMRWGVLGLIIIFQQEIRRFLLLIGRNTSFQENKFLKNIFPQKISYENTDTIHALAEATKAMATTHTGALMVIQREDDLRKYIDSGDDIDATISKRLISNIFFKNSPLHDGAVIIRNGRIAAARCMLPVSESERISPALGFRHRAAVGISEQTDAVVIVVSEEKGEIALVTNGGMFRNMSAEDLEEKLITYLIKK
jgi:diadenylate cyclase